MSVPHWRAGWAGLANLTADLPWGRIAGCFRQTFSWLDDGLVVQSCMMKASRCLAHDTSTFALLAWLSADGRGRVTKDKICSIHIPSKSSGPAAR